MSRKRITAVISLDVEEEGLFRGAYGLTTPAVTNISCMTRLLPLLQAGIRPTLFCAYPVLTHDAAWSTLEKLASRYPMEIGAHLHHWNTPPIILKGQSVKSVPSCEVPLPRLAEKIDTVLEAARSRTGTRPTSFRMGRWDLRQAHWKLLADAGITADASVRPLHASNTDRTRPDHFRAPKNPYLAAAGTRAVFEMPLTVTPLIPGLPEVAGSRLLGRLLLPSYQQWGVLSLLPVYHPLAVMKAVTALALSRGQDVVSLTWHSSEMMPGCNPVLSTQKAVDSLLSRLTNYIEWLKATYDTTFMTLGELCRTRTPSLTPLTCTDADWAGASPNL